MRIYLSNGFFVPLLSGFLCAFGFWSGTAPGQDPFGAAPAAGNDPFGAPAGGADVFGGGASPFGAPQPAATAAAAAVDDQEPADPLVGELRLYANSNNRDLALAIRSAIQIAEWKEAGAFLDILAKRQLTDDQYHDMATIIKPHYMLRLQQEPSLSDAQQATLKKVLDGSSRYARDRGRIRAEISRLDSPSDSERVEAIASLQIGGRSTIAELVTSYVSAQPVASRGNTLSMLRRFGRDSFDAMQRIAIDGNDQQRSLAVQGIAELDVRSAVPDLVAALHGSNSSDAERKVAASELLRVLRGEPSAYEAQVYLSQALERAFDFASRVTRRRTL